MLILLDSKSGKKMFEASDFTLCVPVLLKWQNLAACILIVIDVIIHYRKMNVPIIVQYNTNTVGILQYL